MSLVRNSDLDLKLRYLNSTPLVPTGNCYRFECPQKYTSTLLKRKVQAKQRMSRNFALCPLEPRGNLKIPHQQPSLLQARR